VSEHVTTDVGPIPRDRADRRRLVWMLLRRGDIGAALLEESRHVGEFEVQADVVEAAGSWA
jgi:hypothetical protein